MWGSGVGDRISLGGKGGCINFLSRIPSLSPTTEDNVKREGVINRDTWKVIQQQLWM